MKCKSEFYTNVIYWNKMIYISEESKNVSTFISLNQFGETIKNAVNSSIG